MIDKTCDSTSFGGINDGVLINSEEITAANSTLEISSFSHVGDLLPDFLTHIFNDHVIR